MLLARPRQQVETVTYVCGWEVQVESVCSLDSAYMLDGHVQCMS